MPEIRRLDHYDASAYDEFWCLKPPTLVWLAAVYLARAVLMPLIMAVGVIAGISSDSMSWLRSLWSVEALVPAVAASAVLFVLVRRFPTASSGVRWIYARARVFLASAAVLDFGLCVYGGIRAALAGDDFPAPVLCGLLDVAILVYVFSAARVRAAFAEFPAPELAPAVKKSAK